MMNKISFNDNWTCSRAGEAEKISVTLPHDAMLSEEHSIESPGGKNTGWVICHDYVYEKEFEVPKSYQDSEIVLEFEGVYHNAKVYLNGELAGECAYGYSNFYVPADKFLKYGEKNTVRVEAQNADQPNSRWYSGSGIYRPVWLYELPKQHIALNGIRITTQDWAARKVSVQVETNAPGKVTVEILDGGKVIDSKDADCDGKARVLFALTGCKLWNAEQPNLYTCRVTFGGDVREERFGIRQIECDAQNGFRINGERVILRGACIHHDNGILGAVEHPFAAARKVKLLKQYGYNAIRSAHNPCSKALLDACDRLGMYMMDEYVDMWYVHKSMYDYASYVEKNWRQDMLAMVEKDYNHPSVVMYSTGNEVGETSEKRGIELTKDFTQYLHSIDGTRPVTCGINIWFNAMYKMGFGQYSDEKAKKAAAAKSGKEQKKHAVGSEFFNNLAGMVGAGFMKRMATLPICNTVTKDAYANMDVAGYNYGILRYKGDLRRYPERVIVGSETFCSDARKFWVQAQENPALIGDFVWAGIDYLGEVGIGSWEHADYAPDFSGGPGWVSAGSGRIDLNGRPLGEAYYTRVAFDLDPVALAVVRPDKAFEKHSPSAWKMSFAWPSWTWDGCEGKKTLVEVYTAAHTAALFINGKEVGRKKVGKDAVAEFKAVYEPGEIVAVAYDEAGKEVGRASLRSGGKETVLRALPEQESIGKEDLAYVRLQYTDNAGEVKMLARGEIGVQVEGGELLALGSACPYNERGYLTDKTDTYFGEALAIVRPAADASEVIVRASSPYGNAEARVRCK